MLKLSTLPDFEIKFLKYNKVISKLIFKIKKHYKSGMLYCCLSTFNTLQQWNITNNYYRASAS
jgi:RIO-like serine/threonine protein kinase